MPRPKKVVATTTAPVSADPEPRDSATGRPRKGAEQEIAAADGLGPEPSEINDNLASDRMKALLEDHRAMGSRP